MENSSLVIDSLTVYDHFVVDIKSPGNRIEATSGTRILDADIDTFTNSSQLGAEQDSFGKLFVVTKANGGCQPKFNKFAGALEWRNCVFLWVNLMCKEPSQYPNIFLKEGREIVWFGGSKMTPGLINFNLFVVVCSL